ncbi:MAG: hypothetical protein KA508_07205 [Gammaproteobacteria bacterium]|nr:hypothetical protein [Gammaproteobacteria bacterium]
MMLCFQKGNTASFDFGYSAFKQQACIKMMEGFDFSNPQWVEKASKIHQSVLVELENHLQQLCNRVWLKKQAFKKASKLIKALEELLEASQDHRETYLKKQCLLWELLHELKLDALVEEKIKTAFGEGCFFLVQHTGQMH